MSGQWEVVGKKKDRGSKLPLPKTSNQKDVKTKKNNVLNGVKIEEVLPKSQLQSLYSNKNNKENKKPQEKNKAQDNNVAKKAQKKEKVQEPPKPKPPKSIESALNLIDAEEFKSVYEKSKTLYPESPIVWLKDLVLILNQKVPIEVHDPVFASKPAGYPLNIVPSAIKTVIEKSIKDAGKSNAQLFFDICLASMVSDMGKGLPATGYRFFLQHVARTEPQLVIESTSKHVSLRNSYQNRPNAGLSILWAVGQAGLSDVRSGLSVFRELFLPLLEMKNYSQYVSRYLLDLLNGDGLSLGKEDYLLVLETVFSDRKNVPSGLKAELVGKAGGLAPLLFKNGKESYHGYVDLFLRKIASNGNGKFRDCLCDALTKVFEVDQTIFSDWVKVYVRNVSASSVLLRYIAENWDVVGKKLNKSGLVTLLNSFKTTNEELSLKKRKEDGLKDAIAAIKKIEEKMMEKKSSGFPLKTLLFLVAFATAGLLYVDVKQNGGWKESGTSRLMRHYGVCEYVRKGTDKAKDGLGWVDARIEENFPGYRESVVDFGAPYVELLVDFGKIGRNALMDVKDYAVEKYPVVVASIESYAPGLIEQSQKAASNVYSSSVFYFNRSVDFLKKEVFVGQLSPENVHRVMIEAFNTTQQKATEYYRWIYQKVQTSIK